MMTASTEQSLPADLAPLAPRRAPLRNALLAALGVLVLVGAWFSPAVLQPSLTGSSGGGWSVDLPEAGIVLTVSQLRPTAWPHATVVGVEAVPGAVPVGVWILDSLPAETIEPSQQTDPRRYLEETYPGLELPAEGNLPYRVRSAQQLDIAIVWRIDDCSAFGDAEDGATTFSDLDLSEEATPRGIVRTAFGTESRTTLGSAASPATFLSPGSELCR